ncbi:serine hydrolase [Paenibacillus sp. VMFN-D1]|uniref:serine hydrolase domain-containing protein n=1 Tax=Paenibacillus sp. VMFN-D1 TaxID=2135608 RepID=UPI000E24FBF1|nr:CubicO group peptidase (beta-lactamase class C family) [Paenibacillus sp. VMFN-D1]
MKHTRSSHFQPLNDYVHQVQHRIGATAAAVYIIHKDTVVNEWYGGRHGSEPDSRPVDEKTQFNVASIRKTYLGLAISLLIEQGEIHSIDDAICRYLDKDIPQAEEVTLRHLLTHTHGLTEMQGKLVREFPAGSDWAYRNTGIALLIELVHQLTGYPLSTYMQRNVFDLYGLHETGWRTEKREELIYNYYEVPDAWVGPNDSAAGDQSNLFASARDLARWGAIHMNKGNVGGDQLIPESVFGRIVSPQTPKSLPAHEPLNGFIWWLQRDTPLNQLGERLPGGAYQVLGITGCACLVIPEYDAVVVRMYNQLSNSEDYDYLADIRQFGNMAGDLLRTF